MRDLIIILALCFGVLNSSFGQTSDNTTLFGKWITCKLIDSTEFGNINLESLDSFTTSIRLLTKRPSLNLKNINLDTVKNEEVRYSLIKTFLTPLYDLFHGTWMEFCDDSTVIEHTNSSSHNLSNMVRTFEFNAKTNHLLLDKSKNSEDLLVRVLPDDEMVLSFYSEGINLLVKKVK